MAPILPDDRAIPKQIQQLAGTGNERDQGTNMSVTGNARSNKYDADLIASKRGYRTVR
jgi:hypothetical protein